jgi:S-adenosylmethionine hydrolase
MSPGEASGAEGEDLVDSGLCRDAACVSLLTDFGSADGYVGAVRGILLSIHPRLTIVDVTHDIEPHDVVQASYVLGRHYRTFPRGTVHIAVVDPGVGGKRLGIVVETADYLFVGPDNGIFSYVYEEGNSLVFRIDDSSLVSSKVSDLFHARDIFAPVAARLTLGLPASEVGAALSDYVRLTMPRAAVSDKAIEGHVVHIDSFGNIVTDISHELYRSRIGDSRCKVLIGDSAIETLGRSYDSAEPGQLVAVFGSSGHLEISANRSRASEILHSFRGQIVTVTPV